MSRSEVRSVTRLLPVAALVVGALSLTACGQPTPDNSGTTTANDIPENQGMGGANDGAPGATAAPTGTGTGTGSAAAVTGQPGNAGGGEAAGAQSYPATGRP